MKKIMFNDRYGLTEAVLQGRKTVTRRVISGEMSQCWLQDCMDRNFIMKMEGRNLCAYTSDSELYYSFRFPYKVGEIVAVAQSYRDVTRDKSKICEQLTYHKQHLAAWTNKMFVKADIMPHQIRILNVRAERLQDITEEDCLKEGIWEASNIGLSGATYWYSGLVNSTHRTPYKAFASLIDKISGKGTWNANPFVWRIEFELVK